MRILGLILLTLGFCIQVFFILESKQIIPMLFDSKFQNQTLKLPGESISKIEARRIIVNTSTEVATDIVVWIIPGALMLLGGLIVGFSSGKK